MTTSENKTFSCYWRIENYSFAFQRCGEFLLSPKFKADNLCRGEWMLYLYPRGFKTNVRTVDCMLIGAHPDEEEIFMNVQFELFNSGGDLISRKRILQEGRKNISVTLIELTEHIPSSKPGQKDYVILRTFMTSVPPLLESGASYSHCQFSSKICVDRYYQTYSIRLTDRAWFEVRRTNHKDIKFIFELVDFHASIKMCSEGSPRFIFCKITLLDKKGQEVLFKQTARLFSNEIWTFPGTIDDSILDNSISTSMKFRITMFYSTGNVRSTWETFDPNSMI